ncbi:MAG: ribosome small subunit-dependent GTPase A [bacterium]
MNTRTALEQLGYDSRLHKDFARLGRPDWRPARVVADHGARLVVDDGLTRSTAAVRGALEHAAADRADLPAIGDWVAVSAGDPRPVEAVLPRRGALVRKAAGTATAPQVIAAHVDTAFVVAGLDGDFNPRKIDRLLVALAASGAQTVVLLNKADLPVDREAARARLPGGAAVSFVSARTGEGVDVVAALLGRGRTGVLVGASGTGKSSLINRLLGAEVQDTGGVRRGDDRGRHTTTARSLLMLPDDGGMIIDTPGVRELGLWAGGAAVEEVFADVTALAARCRFRDCRHEQEPDCAVRAAIEAGALDPARLAHLDKLQRELAFAQRQQDERARKAEHDRWKQISRQVRSRRVFEGRHGGKG